MHQNLFTIGKLSIPTYTVLLDLGLILALALAYYEAKRQRLQPDQILDVGLWIIIGGILSGRLGFVVGNWGAFSEDWGRIVRLWEGGLSFHGAFLGGLLVLFFLTELGAGTQDRPSFWELADLLTPSLALAFAFGWAACLMGGSAYGRLGEGFGTLVLPDIYGVVAPRFATQILGLAFALLLLLNAWLLRERWPFPGAAFLIFTLLYFAGQFFLDLTRGDEAIVLGPWRITQIMDLILAFASAAGLLVLWRQSQAADFQDPGQNPSAPEPTPHNLPLEAQ